MGRLIVIVSLLFFAAINAGCATLADAQAAKGSGSFKVYSQPYDTVTAADWEKRILEDLDRRLQRRAEDRRQ